MPENNMLEHFYGEVTASPVVQQAYQDWVLADFREASIMQGARMEGVEETARRMLKKGLSVDTIMECTDLTKEQVESLR